MPCPCVQLSVQNQELIEKNLTLQEQLRQARLTAQPLPADAARLAQELHGELASCLQDLQSVYSIVTQRAQGKDPNLSLLLGIHCEYLSFRAAAEQTLLSALWQNEITHTEHGKCPFWASESSECSFCGWLASKVHVLLNIQLLQPLLQM